MNQEDLRLLIKYLKGGTTREESMVARNLLVRLEEDEVLKQLLLEEWHRTSGKNELSLDPADSWSAIKEAMSGNTTTTLNSSESSGWPRIAVAAAIVLVIAVGGLFFHQWPGSNPGEDLSAEVAYLEKRTGKGEKLNISLPDGSFIKLNSSTSLHIPSNYPSNDERVVYLEGEAFFEIAKFEKKPFKVITGEVTTTVLGTAFNVEAHVGNDEVSIALVSGKVKVANADHEIILHNREMTTIKPSAVTLSKNSFDIEQITGWRDNVLIFNEITFQEIIGKLEQWYGVEIEIQGNPVAGRKYSGRFENKSLALVLEGLGFSSAFDYEIKGKSVFLNFKK